MRTLEILAGDLAEYVESRRRFVDGKPKGFPAALTAPQHMEIARMYLSSGQMMNAIQGSEGDLVRALESFYTGLAHLAVALNVTWGVVKVEDTTNADAAPTDG